MELYRDLWGCITPVILIYIYKAIFIWPTLSGIFLTLRQDGVQLDVSDQDQRRVFLGDEASKEGLEIDRALGVSYGFLGWATNMFVASVS